MEHRIRVGQLNGGGGAWHQSRQAEWWAGTTTRHGEPAVTPAACHASLCLPSRTSWRHATQPNWNSSTLRDTANKSFRRLIVAPTLNRIGRGQGGLPLARGGTTFPRSTPNRFQRRGCHGFGGKGIDRLNGAVARVSNGIARRWRVGRLQQRAKNVVAVLQGQGGTTNLPYPLGMTQTPLTAHIPHIARRGAAAVVTPHRPTAQRRRGFAAANCRAEAARSGAAPAASASAAAAPGTGGSTLLPSSPGRTANRVAVPRRPSSTDPRATPSWPTSYAAAATATEVRSKKRTLHHTRRRRAAVRPCLFVLQRRHCGC
eukprot:356057-Chlamydomonas_euryale.AAC.2